VILLLLAGCLDRMFESPYVLATGLGEVRSITPGLDGHMLAATSTGVWSVDGGGVTRQLSQTPARAVATHPRRMYTLVEDAITWEGGSASVPGAVDFLAGFGPLVVLFPDAVDTLDPDTGTRARLVAGIHDARAVALGTEGTYLVVTADSVLSVSATGAVTPLATGLVNARAAVMDDRSRVYVAQGEPSELWRIDPSGLVRIARWLEEPRDLQFGTGGAFPTENAYIAAGDGTLDYVRPPP
jgi:hypothetical protein